MNEEIRDATSVALKLAKDSNLLVTGNILSGCAADWEAFYRAAYNKAIEDAATKAGRMVNGKSIAAAIKKLEMK